MSASASEPLGSICPVCRRPSVVRLAADHSCAHCESAHAWARHRGAPLIITVADVDEAVRRRAGEAAPRAWWRRAITAAGPVASLVLAGAAAFTTWQLWQPVAVGPLAGIVAAIQSRSVHVLVAGIAAACAGIVAMIRLGRNRHFRRVGFLVSHAAAVVFGVVATIVGGLAVAGTFGDTGLRYHAMPPLSALSPVAASSPTTARIAGAAAIVIAADEDGDASAPSFGSGVVIATGATTAWLVTNRHVAAPRIAVPSGRAVASLPAVWVQLADGRGALGHVRWLADPPVDIALVEVSIDHPPVPVPVAADSDEVVAGDAVSFVPNPLRRGWLVHHGRVVRRDPHDTPAGRFSLVYSDLPVQPGDSGSGLFNEYGELIGINTWTRLDGGPSGISLPATTMRALVAAIEHDTLQTLVTPPTPTPTPTRRNAP